MFEIKKNKSTLDKKHLELMELMLRHENLNRQTEEFLNELKVSPEQLTTYLENKEHFTEKTWNELQKERTKIEEKTQTELNSIRNPLQIKKAYSEKNIARHWIPVR